ncbi:MAG: DUF502 domain-containing protein [Candidatus Eisenbacteria bacterium]|uniref:DUF502 domain-containing protein n=1 Tax=Eiseniibacteriota bacterium TaxID=2212470 RepID=A0A7Y2E9X7_UNCEI|nr:DUF502 domain-containing protein [Candidatus Eisenbacteria bacterium]
MTSEEPKKPLPKVLKGNLRRHFLTGLLVVTPTVVAAWILYRLFAFTDGLLWENIRFGWVRPGGIPGVGAVTVLALILLVGVLVNNYLGRRLYGFWESMAVRIPLFNKIYLAVKQIGEALLANEKNVFRAVGLIEYPRRGMWAMVFLTEPPGSEIQKHVGESAMSVFLPTTPNPTSGFFLMVPEKDIRVLSMPVEDGMKMVISGGSFVPVESAPGDIVPIKEGSKRRWWQSRGSASDAASDSAPDSPSGSPPDSASDPSS